MLHGIEFIVLYRSNLFGLVRCSMLDVQYSITSYIIVRCFKCCESMYMSEGLDLGIHSFSSSSSFHFFSDRVDLLVTRLDKTYIHIYIHTIHIDWIQLRCRKCSSEGKHGDGLGIEQIIIAWSFQANPNCVLISFEFSFDFTQNQ